MRPTLPARAQRLGDSPWFWPVVVFAVALLLRLLFVNQIRYTPFFQALGLDARYYDTWARELAAGSPRAEAFFMSPLYPYFLAGIYRLFGRDLLVVRVVQAVIGSLSAVLAYKLAARVFDRGVAIIAGLLVAGYGALIFYDGAILLTPLLVFLNLLMLLLLVEADASGRPPLYLAAGLVLGLAAVGKATVLVFVPVAVAWIWTGRTRKPGPGATPGGAKRRRPERAKKPLPGAPSGGWLRPAAFLVIGVLVAVVPVTVRNYVASGDFIILTSNGGLNFYLGNGDISTGGCVVSDGHDMVADPPGRWIAEADLGRELTASEISSYWAARARRFITEEPGAWLKLLARKLAFVMNAYELPQLEYYDFQKRYSAVLSLPLPSFSILAPLGLVGFWLSFRRRRARILALFFAIYVLSIVAFFVLARYRLPAIPPLIVGAGFAVTEIARHVRDRRWRWLVGAAVALAALLVLVNSNPYRVDRRAAFAQPHFRLGIIFGQRGLIDRAIEEYRRSIALDPDYMKSHLNLGALLAERGEMEAAAEAFRSAIRIEPEYGPARVNLAMAFQGLGDYEAALAHVDTALKFVPGDAAAHKQRGIVLYRMGLEEEARSELAEALRLDAGGTERAEIEFYMAKIEGSLRGETPEAALLKISRSDSLIQVGRVVEALAELTEAARIAPESGEPLMRIALLKKDLGLTEEAIELMRRALAIDPGLEHGHFGLGVLLSDLGRHDEAIDEYERELRLFPDFAPAHLNLGLTYQHHAGNPDRAAFHYRRYLALGGERVEVAEALLRKLGLARE